MTARSSPDLAARAARIGEEVAGPAAGEVDRLARFPTEAVDALKADQQLSALVPKELGGGGFSVGSVARAATALGRHCASAAMVYAMHQLQVACLVRHGHTDRLGDYIKELVDDQLLLASATTELGVGGDIRSSICAVDHDGGRFRLAKQAPVISYGAHADGILATARRTPDSPPNDQVLVLCTSEGYSLTATSGWDTLGFRGTCSLGFELHAEGDSDQVFADPFSDISAQTMLPVSHILWSSVWLGLAAAAMDRARQVVRSEARKNAGMTSPAAMGLAELMTTFQQMEALVRGATATYDELSVNPNALSSMGFAILMNGLKVSASTLVVDIVGRAMLICGISGYREDSPYSLGRLLRDAYGAAVMVNNNRVVANNAQMLLVYKED